MTTYESKGIIHGAFYQSPGYERTFDEEAFEKQDVEMFTYFINPKTGHLDFRPKTKK